MADEFPAPRPAYMGEWVFNGTTSPPPATSQIRFNDSTKATLIYINNLTFNGVDASSILMTLIPGCSIHLENKTDSGRWQDYAITGDPVARSGYVELTVTWTAGSAIPISAANVMLGIVAMAVRVTGSAALASVGNAAVSISSRTVISPMPRMVAETTSVSVAGHIHLPDAAFPSDTPAGFSAGMTLRQWYAGQALAGFIANSNAANLIGTLPQYAFALADNMIAYEKKTTGPPPAVPEPVPSISTNRSARRFG